MRGTADRCAKARQTGGLCAAMLKYKNTEEFVSSCVNVMINRTDAIRAVADATVSARKTCDCLWDKTLIITACNKSVGRCAHTNNIQTDYSYMSRSAKRT